MKLALKARIVLLSKEIKRIWGKGVMKDDDKLPRMITQIGLALMIIGG